MNREAVIHQMQQRTGWSKTKCEDALDYTLDAIIRVTIANGRLLITGFGKFEIKMRAPRKGRNPRNGEPAPIPERPRVIFSAADNLHQLAEDPDRMPNDRLVGGRAPATKRAESSA